MKQLVGTLLRSERGQDVIEYALLTAAIGLAGVATLPVFHDTLRDTYHRLNTNTQDLWVPPDPGAGS